MGDDADRNDDAVRKALHAWRDSLLSLTGQNRLLNYRPTRTSTIELVEMSADEVLARINAGKGVPVAGLIPAAIENAASTDDLEGEALSELEHTDLTEIADHLYARKTQRDVDRGLRLLSTTATREYLDRGLSVLYLALGSLHWREQNGDARVSPLIFVPVELRSSGPKQPHHVYPSPEDPVVNPALDIKMREHGITLPTQSDVEAALADSGFEGVDALFRALSLPPSWHVEHLCVLSIFMFAKEAMYRDLEANEETILQSELIGGLVGADQSLREKLTFEPVDPSTIDSVAPPEETPLILDADSSQRVAVAATAQGKSFVLDGPPGTGKSQTIANISATLMASGKRVLFVSEKAVALDVVRDRLTHRGLGPLLFELHSHKATRREVAQSLGKALGSRPSVTQQAPPSSARAKATREELTDYAKAMNERRLPLGWSLFDALGRLANLPDVSSLPPAAIDAPTFTEVTWNEISDLADALDSGWSHIAQGDRHPWHGITRTDGLEFELANARRSLNRLLDSLDAVAPDRGLLNWESLDSWGAVAKLSSLWHSAEPEWRDIEWLSIGSLDTLEAVARFLNDSDSALVEESRLEAEVGTDWKAHGTAGASRSLPTEIEAFIPMPHERPASELSASATEIAKVSVAARWSSDAAEAMAAYLGLPSPTYPAHHRVLKHVADLITQEPHLRSDWLSAEAVDNLRDALETLHTAQSRAAGAGDRASAFFRDSVTTVDLDQSSAQWNARNSISRAVIGPTRADKELIGPHSVMKIRAGMAHLDLAMEWRDSLSALDESSAAVRSKLGWAPTNEDEWTRAYELVERAAAVVAQVGAVPGSSTFNSSAGEYQRAELLRATHQLRDAVRDLEICVERAGVVTFVESRPVDDIIAATETAASGLSTSLAIAAPFTAGGSRSLTNAWALQDAVRDAALKSDALRVELKRLEDTYPGLRTADSAESVAHMRRRVEWTAAVLTLVDGIGADARRRALSSLSFRPDLEANGDSWAAARSAVLDRFVGRDFTLSRDLGDAEDAQDLLDQFSETIHDAGELMAAREHFESLAALGLRTVLEEILQSGNHQPPSGLLRASTISAWMASQVRADKRLATRGPVSRGGLVDLFRDLDRDLVESAAAQVLTKATSRRPSVPSAQTAVIQAEAQKKRRHIAVRDLIARATDVIQAIHPCFMMSPLAVSQYLPPTIRFDYVIFDEASQVPPADAINCLYRASSVIAAGDQKQLPPTSFFASSQQVDDDIDQEDDLSNDYESVLDLMKSSGSYTSIGLRWHYRSRHEHLIAYSNNSFYSDSLVTFPGAHADVEDAGVKLLKVDGIYRRSQGQDNPIEARHVAERVIHHLDTRPGKSVGVVAMSAAQRDAISNALQLLRGDRPDLESNFAESRLDGIFVKSLEEVQGDERDVMIISIGYGPDSTGTVYKNFGPINKKGGERRLNVAITRAKELTEVVTSMTAGDIGDISSSGGRHLRRYLDYAERGPAALEMELGPEGLGTDSPFEDAVISAIRSWGYDVQPQVGVSGFRIDIGVKHPSAPGVFMLGIECDGAMYHSAQSARDRDRLRHDILVGLGWTMHHIWGTDWYRNRPAEEAKLRALLEQLEAVAPVGRVGGNNRPTPAVVLVEESAELLVGTRPEWVVEYDIPPLPRLRLLDWTDSFNAPHLVDFVTAIANAEAPVHIDTVKARLRAASFIDRVNKRALRTLTDAIALSTVTVDGDFLLVNGYRSRPVRSAGERSLVQVHDSEFTSAVTQLIGSMVGATRKDLVVATSRAFGWLRTPNELPGRLEGAIDSLIASGSVSETNGILNLLKRP
ncbi:DUF4011 domain-containing protein [Microbacterium sp. 179-I 3D2 NHS]|uniref:DUF4011 domain-containing protein n=1 Tax=Microbacterium sp. 179-I 3D2 NHS TaxID=3235178 RepID=UPI0039A37B33